MTHSDDEGLVLPPKLAPIQVVIVPIPKPEDELLSKANEIGNALKAHGIKVKIDTDDTKRPGFKFAAYERAKRYRENHFTAVDDYSEFKVQLETKGGFFFCHWDGTHETEEKIKEETKATIRCIPFDMPSESGVCMYSGKPSERRVVFAKAY